MEQNCTVSKDVIVDRFKAIQDEICEALSQNDGGASFVEDLWERPEGGGGRTRILENGNVIVKGGVNFSAVHGAMDEKIAKELGFSASDFFATGVSIVIHPINPNVPIIHMNIRYFELDANTWWFGGGIDLTPHWVNEEQTKWFHQQLKGVCDQFSTDYHPKFKEWADNYFYIPHREETRGVGGIFFDRLNTSNYPGSKSDLFEFTAALGESFSRIYTQLMDSNKTKKYSEEDLDWQKVRRSRYVEFNLIYDRGTTFGLKSNGRVESILMSLPPDTGWEYNRAYSEREKTTLEKLVKGIDWINYTV
ncbi:MAG: coproporphyrinogen III oxidase [Sphingobacteriales bacterium]|jgi:coproporphyrinogen III oxidase